MDEQDAYVGNFLSDDGGIDGISVAELESLGERYGFAVGDEGAPEIRDAVNAMVDGLEDVETVAAVGGGSTSGDRSWWSPDSDPHNAIATACSVPPTTEDGPLAGLDVGLKDNVAVAGVPLEAGSDVLYGHVAATDATVVDRLRAAGATIAAKTRMDELAGGGGGSNSRAGPVLNPHDERRVPGGSSSGSAAAVASGRVDVALGTDTGGSVRIPASFCGIVGLLPTYGLVPLSGVVEATYTQDAVGPMTTTVHDAACVLEAIAGKDPADPASLQAAGRDGYRTGGYVAAVEDPPDPAELRVGVLEAAFEDGVDDDVADRVRGEVERVADAGASVETVVVEDLLDAGKVAKTTASYVELADHWRAGGATPRRNGTIDPRYQAAFARHRRAASGDLGRFATAKVLAGARITEATDGRYYTLARAVLRRVGRRVRALFDEVDVVATPTMPAVAPRIEDATDPGFDYALQTRIATIAGVPAISIPAGTVEGLPVGLQLLGDRFDERTVLGAAESVSRLSGN
jgi:amidase/aspartyl-tRNA(Asn)/glutamyl-tRNA(Gln) amidotransferase subunit A